MLVAVTYSKPAMLALSGTVGIGRDGRGHVKVMLSAFSGLMSVTVVGTSQA